MHPSDPTKIENLLSIMSALRHPETGCPWDIEQNFDSIVPHTLEEAYEVEEAVRARDWVALKQELGDLLLQVVFHSQMAAESDLFTFEDVVEGISAKLISRHPHVFGEESSRSVEEHELAWEKQKSTERQEKGEQGALEGVAKSLPALLRAYKIQKRSSAVGFDWPDFASVCDKVAEEWSEVQEAIETEEQSLVEEELGDLLFALANVVRMLGAEPEALLRHATYKFEQRFAAMEALAKARNQDFVSLSLADKDALWDEVKAAEERDSSFRTRPAINAKI
jgi:ATP diphosphatase